MMPWHGGGRRDRGLRRNAQQVITPGGPTMFGACGVQQFSQMHRGQPGQQLLT